MRLRRDKIVVALEHKVLMYNFADLRLEHSTETASNPKGLVSLSAAPEHNVVACPGLHCGQVSASRSLQYEPSASDCGNLFVVETIESSSCSSLIQYSVLAVEQHKIFAIAILCISLCR